MSQGSRPLKPEEIALWFAVARHVTPRSGFAPVAEPAHHKALPAPVQRHNPPALPPAPQSPLPLVPLEPQLRRQLTRGRRDIDAKLDLHGLNQAQAHQALRDFLLSAQARGDRLVIIITGKGRGEETGVLRRSVPHWLSAPELRSLVLSFEQAAPHHGGAGALYVRLRRLRG